MHVCVRVCVHTYTPADGKALYSILLSMVNTVTLLGANPGRTLDELVAPELVAGIVQWWESPWRSEARRRA